MVSCKGFLDFQPTLLNQKIVKAFIFMLDIKGCIFYSFAIAPIFCDIVVLLSLKAILIHIDIIYSHRIIMLLGGD